MTRRSAKNLFIITLPVAVLTILGSWLGGLRWHHSIYINALIATSLLSIGFFVFIATGLYTGTRIRDDMGRMGGVRYVRIPDLSSMDLSAVAGAAEDSIAGAIIGVLLWLVVATVIMVFVWFLGAVLWSVVLGLIAGLYWIFFRALRLVFRHAAACSHKLLRSIGCAFLYTLLYNSWIYGIIVGVHYLLR